MKMPDFSSEQEEMEYWEKHSIADYWNDLSECSDTFQRPKLDKLVKSRKGPFFVIPACPWPVRAGLFRPGRKPESSIFNKL